MVFVLLSVNCQNISPRRPFKPISFTNYQPLWYTTLIDSSMIEKPIRRNHLNFLTLNDNSKNLVNGNNLFFCLDIGRESDSEGSYIGSLDITSGQIKWRNYFSLKTQDRQEFTQSMTAEGEKIELIGMKTQSLYGSGIFSLSLFDTMCWMTNRAYDKNTGNILQNIQADPSDPNTQRLAWSGRKLIKYSQIFKNGENKYRYIHHHKVRPENTIDLCDLNEDGVRITDVKSVKLNKRIQTFNIFQIKEDQYLLIDDDFIVENNRYTLNFLNDDFDTLRSVRISDYIPLDAFVQEVNKEDEYIVMSTTTYDALDSFYLYPEKLLWIVDFDGNTIKKVKMVDNKERHMHRYVYTYDRSKDELIVAHANGQGLFDPPKGYLHFYTAKTGVNKLDLRSEIFLEDSLKVAFLHKMIQTPSGNLIILWNEVDVYQKNDRYDDFDIYSSATSYVSFDPKTLGLVSSSSDITRVQKLKLYPNPTSGIVNIQNLINPSSINIYNSAGVKLKSYENITEQLDITDLPSGMYFLDIKNKEINERHKIVKVE